MIRYIILTFLVCINLNLLAQDISLTTDVRVVMKGKKTSTDALEYSISLTGYEMDFKCNNCSSNFSLEIHHFVESTKVDGYTMVRYATTEPDDIILIYNFQDNLIAVGIHQYNDVILIYMDSNNSNPYKKSSPEDKTYKL